MVTVSEPMTTSDALGGADGTQLPEPLPVLADPLTGLELSTRWDVPELPPLVLLPIPDASVTALSDDLTDEPTDDPTRSVDQHSAELPDPQSAPQATGQPDAPNVNAPNVAVPSAAVPSAAVPSATVGVPPHSAASVGRPARPPMAAVSRKFVSTADPGRRIRRERVGLPPQTRSNGGVAALLLFMLIMICLLVYKVVTGFWEWISSFLQ
jgi:hypothetical protein